MSIWNSVREKNFLLDKSRIMNKKFNCICYSDNWQTEKFGKFLIVKCLNCGLKRTYPIPNKISVGKENFNYRLQKIKLWKKFDQKILDLVKKYKNNNRIKLLDIGCNIGLLVKLSKENGVESIGIDLDDKAVDFGKSKFGVDLRKTSLENAKFNEDEFDVVVLSHTLEHILKLNNLLIEIHKVLKSNGILIIQVPNIEGLTVRIQKIRKKLWYGYDLEHHVWHFSPNTLSKLMNKYNFKIKELNSSENLFYEKDGRVVDFFRNIVLKISSLLNLADQITLVAMPKK